VNPGLHGSIKGAEAPNFRGGGEEPEVAGSEELEERRAWGDWGLAKNNRGEWRLGLPITTIEKKPPA
jgi:hypothetical protein